MIIWIENRVSSRTNRSCSSLRPSCGRHCLTDEQSSFALATVDGEHDGLAFGECECECHEVSYAPW